MNHFIHSCNGLVYLSNRRGDVIYLWNPLTKQFKTLPTPKKQVNFPQLDLGFGFDSISNDYKLFRIVWSDILFDNYAITYVLKVELYSTKANFWKEIQFLEIVHSFLTCYDTKCVSNNGLLYMDGNDELLLFNSHTEVFRVYPFPNYVHLKRKSDILDYEGFVAIILESVCDRSVFSLWTLDNDCGKVSWIKKFNIEADHGFSLIALYLGVGQYVARNCNARYVCFDSTKKDNNKLPFTPPVSGI
ncbi:hypothetical protein POM88_029152 [Heracleum sosnowskyi]|uniref:F-box associated beta-propeller type 3 domain-containing protein n=1 Tax=Heracleum sosnowskyi TaxID=360622 RepID=A0AAD8HUE5_9APIA|nr:hypothetical protein POM88_029152 [Heracleum sosnowskyi]